MYQDHIEKLRELEGAQSRDSDSLLVRAAVYQSVFGGSFKTAIETVYVPVGKPKKKNKEVTNERPIDGGTGND